MTTRTHTGFAWFYAGTAALGTVIGLLIGISNSPVVAVVIPLLFALLSAGGTVLVVLGKEGGDGNSSADRKTRAQFLGRQLLAFSLACALGLWGGVWAKFNSTRLWHQPPAQDAVADVTFSDVRVLAAFVELDRRLKDNGVEVERRRAVLRTLHTAIVARQEENKLSSTDEKALDSLLNQSAKPSDPVLTPSAVATMPESQIQEMLRKWNLPGAKETG